MKLYLIFKRSFAKYTQLLKTVPGLFCRKGNRNKHTWDTKPCSHSAVHKTTSVSVTTSFLPIEAVGHRKHRANILSPDTWNNVWGKKASTQYKGQLLLDGLGLVLVWNYPLTVKKGHSVQLLHLSSISGKRTRSWWVYIPTHHLGWLAKLALHICSWEWFIALFLTFFL